MSAPTSISPPQVILEPSLIPPAPVIGDATSVVAPLSVAVPVAAPGVVTAKTSARPEFSRMRQRWVGFWWWVLMPLDCVDLKTGLPEHDRLVSLAVGIGLGFKILTETGYPPLGITALAISAMFGVRVFKLWLNRSKFEALSTDALNVNKTLVRTVVIERKSPAEPSMHLDDERGEEPADGRVG